MRVRIPYTGIGWKEVLGTAIFFAVFCVMARYGIFLDTLAQLLTN